MTLPNTYKHLRELLVNIAADLDKAENGNKAASQRVRTGTVRLEKVAKIYRKESISSEKGRKGTRRAAGRAVAVRAKAARKPARAKAMAGAARMKASPKAKAARASVRPRQLALKRATAKLPTRRFEFN